MYIVREGYPADLLEDQLGQGSHHGHPSLAALVLHPFQAFQGMNRKSYSLPPLQGTCVHFGNTNSKATLSLSHSLAIFTGNSQQNDYHNDNSKELHIAAYNSYHRISYTAFSTVIQ